MSSSTVRFKSQNHNIVGLLDIPNNNKESIVLLLHGLTNSMKDCPLISEATEAFRSEGFPTFRFDYFGSGLSNGEFKEKTFSTLIRNTQDALEFITNQLHFKKVGIWGRSVGAILGATISDYPQVFASVLFSTTIHTHTSFSSLFQNNGDFSVPIKGTGAIKGEPILPRKFYEETIWIDELQKKHLSKAKHVLIIQGTADKTVYDTSWAREIFQLTKKPKKLLYIKDADHSYYGYEPQVIKEGLKWFTNIT